MYSLLKILVFVECQSSQVEGDDTHQRTISWEMPIFFLGNRGLLREYHCLIDIWKFVTTDPGSQ